MDEVFKGSPTYLAKAIVAVPQVKNCLFGLFLKKINEQCQSLCARSKEKVSVLRVTRKDHESINTFRWIDVLREMKERAPDVLNVQVTIAISKLKEDGSQVPRICMAMGILMNTRSQEMSLVQKLTSVTLGTGGATLKVSHAILYNQFLYPLSPLGVI